MLTSENIWNWLPSLFRLPSFFILEKWFRSTSGEVWYDQLASIISLVLAVLFICLRRDHLFELYRNLLGLILLTLAYFYAQNLLDDTIPKENKINVIALFRSFLVTSTFSLLALFVSRDISYRFLMVSSLPVLATFVGVGLPAAVIHYVQYFANELLYCYLVYHALEVLTYAINNLIGEIKKISLTNIFGFYLDVNCLVDSVFLHQQLMLFWLTSFSFNALYYAMQTYETNIFLEDWMTILSMCVRDCSKTYVGLIALGVAVSYASCFVRSLLIFVVTDVL